MNEKIVFSDLYFINSEKMGDFIREMNNIHNRRKTGSITDQEHDILAYCPLKPRNYLINQVIGEKLEIELKKAEDKLNEIKNTQYLKSELETANSEMNEIQGFQLFRSSSTKQKQISEQQRKIDSIQQKAISEKEKLTEQQNKIINKIKLDIQNAEY